MAQGMNRSRREVQLEDFFKSLFSIFLNAYILMFLAAAIHKRFGVWGAIGYYECLPWTAGFEQFANVLTIRVNKQRD